MKNKKLCAKCKYRGTIGARDIRNIDNLMCDYAGVMKETAMKHGKNGETYDSRGEDFNTCLLYEEGEALGRLRSEEFIEHMTIKNKRRA